MSNSSIFIIKPYLRHDTKRIIGVLDINTRSKSAIGNNNISEKRGMTNHFKERLRVKILCYIDQKFVGAQKASMV